MVPKTSHAPTFSEGIARARDEFSQYPWVKALHEAGLAPFFGDAHDYWCVHTGGREAFIKRAHDSAVSTFAILIDGEWVERGDMGRFGMPSGDVSEDEWHTKVGEILDGLPDDAWLAVVDVHT